MSPVVGEPGFAAIRRKLGGDLADRIVNQLRARDNWYDFRDDPKLALTEAERIKVAEHAEREKVALLRSRRREYQDTLSIELAELEDRYRMTSAVAWRKWKAGELDDPIYEKWMAMYSRYRDMIGNPLPAEAPPRRYERFKNLGEMVMAVTKPAPPAETEQEIEARRELARQAKESV